MCLGRDWLAAIAASQPSGGTLPGSDQWEAGPVARARHQAKSVSVIYGWCFCLSTPPPPHKKVPAQSFFPQSQADFLNLV
jgi:hypothetical protein